MRKTLIIFAVMLTAAGAWAQLSEEYANWGDSPVKFMMTSNEITAWKAVKTDAEAKEFIDLFWAKRDPTPATPENEWREEFNNRVAVADQHFSTTKMKGSLTDRGRVVILLGSPSEVKSQAGARRSSPASDPGADITGGVDVPSATPRPARLTWTYSGTKKPASVKKKDFDVVFLDESGRGEWLLGTNERSKPEVVLQEALMGYIFSPDLTKAPYFGPPLPKTAFDDPALQKAYEDFRAGEAEKTGPGLLTWGEFVTPEGESFAAIQLFVPGKSGIEAGRAVTFVGVIEDETGKVVEVHEEPATLTASIRDSFVDDTFMLATGKYKASFGIAENGQVLAMTRTDITIEGIDPKAPGISNLMLANHVFPLTEGQAINDPFAFGGLKVVPKADGLFARSDDFWYFFELRNPGLSEAGAPKVQVKINVDGKSVEGKPIKMEMPFQEVETIPLKGMEGRYGLGMAFPLETFQLGEYTIKMRVLDTILKKSWDFEGTFEVR